MCSVVYLSPHLNWPLFICMLESEAFGPVSSSPPCLVLFDLGWVGGWGLRGGYPNPATQLSVGFELRSFCATIQMTFVCICICKSWRGRGLAPPSHLVVGGIETQNIGYYLQMTLPTWQVGTNMLSSFCLQWVDSLQGVGSNLLFLTKNRVEVIHLHFRF